MTRHLLLVVLLLAPARAALSSCAAPKFPTKCVKAKVLRSLPVDARIGKWFGEANPVCHFEISATGYQGAIYSLGEQSACPKPGTTIRGDINVRCNDAGEDLPDTFVLKTDAACGK